jgi:Ca2+-transporting ATPase
MKFGFVLVTVFFCYRDGEFFVAQLRLGLTYFLGEAQQIYLQTIGDTTRAVLYGLVFAAMGQGVMAGIGYAMAGVKAPVLLGALTTVMGLIPMGANLVWLPICLMLIFTDQLWAGVGLLVWGVLVISRIDDVIRLLIISGANRIPFLIALFGIFGGLSAFGLVGVFIGPVVLRLLLVVWQVWAQQKDLTH